MKYTKQVIVLLVTLSNLGAANGAAAPLNQQLRLAQTGADVRPAGKMNKMQLTSTTDQIVHGVAKKTDGDQQVL